MNEIKPPQNNDEFAARSTERLGEVVELVTGQKTKADFPRWVINVMQILKEQKIPRELDSIASPGIWAFYSGIGIGLSMQAKDVIASAGEIGTSLKNSAAETVGRLYGDEPEEIKTDLQALAADPKIQAQIMQGLFAPKAEDRKLFVQGMLLGIEFLDRLKARPGTDATDVYTILWMYWPEVTQCNSIASAAKALEWSVAESTLPGWPERFRKIANRIKLSFKTKKPRRKNRSSGETPAP